MENKGEACDLYMSIDGGESWQSQLYSFIYNLLASSKSTYYLYQQLACTCCKYNANPKISIHKQQRLSPTKVHFFLIKNAG